MTSTTPAPPFLEAPSLSDPAPQGRLPALGWLLTLLALGYVAFIHHGLGPSAESSNARWYQPLGYLLDNETVGELSEPPQLGIAILSIPAILLTLGIFATSRSSIARAIALSSVASVALLCFYSFVGYGVWEFFHWRGSVVILATGLAAGMALASPLLAASWLRQRGWVQLLLYLPILLGVVTLMRHATGTNETMFFNLSPWPALTVLGLERGVYMIVGIQLGLAVGLAGIALLPQAPPIGGLVALGGALTPILWGLLGRFPRPGAAALAALAVITASAIGIGSITRPRGDSERVGRRAIATAVGAGMVILPLLAGRSLAEGDYAVTRFVRAEQIITHLAQWYEKEGVYPEELDELVTAHYLEEIPRPRVGFDLVYSAGWIDAIEFSYRNLGSSYVLEFESTEWVQCAYNPPWAYDEDEELDEEDLEEVDEAWSCPDTRPELW